MPATSQAASFDCSKAANAFEKAICVDTELSDLDAQLNKKYVSALTRLSEDGKAVLRDGERQWLHFIREVCLNQRNADRQSKCLRSKYDRRLSELDTAALQMGAYVFSRRDHFASLPSTQDRSDDHRPYEAQGSYLYIDRPVSAPAAQFNKESTIDILKALEMDGYCDNAPADVTTDFSVQRMGASVISVARIWGYYCHGAPHGWGNPAAHETYVLVPELHRLAAKDLFDLASPWAKTLTERMKAVIADRTKDLPNPADIDQSTVADEVADPKNWTLSDQGMTLTVSSEEWLGYAGSVTEVTIPWAELRPFLASTAPVPK